MNILNKIKQFFYPQYNLNKQSKDKYGRADLSNFNKNIKIIEEKDIPPNSNHIISGYVVLKPGDCNFITGEIPSRDWSEIIRRVKEQE